MKGVTPVYIGWDAREPLAWEVCDFSIRRRATAPIKTVKLAEPALRKAGLFGRRYLTEEDGQRVDVADGRPYSTSFAFTRFIVPRLTRTGWAVFCDGDFLFLKDIAELLELADDRYAVMVVKHQHKPSETTKMDGVKQGPYPRKNWSSLVLWNCDHDANREMVNDRDFEREGGRWLHAFEWLRDDEIGALPEEWNWLAGASPTIEGTQSLDIIGKNGAGLGAIHYTSGGPWFADHTDCPFSQAWVKEAADLASYESGQLLMEIEPWRRTQDATARG